MEKLSEQVLERTNQTHQEYLLKLGLTSKTLNRSWTRRGSRACFAGKHFRSPEVSRALPVNFHTDEPIGYPDGLGLFRSTEFRHRLVSSESRALTLALLKSEKSFSKTVRNCRRWSSPSVPLHSLANFCVCHNDSYHDVAIDSRLARV